MAAQLACRFSFALFSKPINGPLIRDSAYYELEKTDEAPDEYRGVRLDTLDQRENSTAQPSFQDHYSNKKKEEEEQEEKKIK